MQYLSIKKAREMLGWSPKMNFESGLLEAMAWYTEFFLETQSVELRIDNPI
jgi:CDP-glucose 4,6-dehydratase